MKGSTQEASRFPPAAPGSLEALVHSYREKPVEINQASIERYARAHLGTSEEGMANLALATSEVEHGNLDKAIAHAAIAQKRLPELADYEAFFVASGYAARKESGEVERALKPVWDAKPESPLVANAAVLLAHSYMDSGQPDKALAALEKHRDEIPAARAALAYGRALEAMGRGAEAARQYQTIYYEHPLAGEASDAEKALAVLREKQGYPEASQALAVERARGLLDGGQPAIAQHWLDGVVSRLDGENRDAARVLIGAAEFNQKHDAVAFAYLKALAVGSPEADAERLYYLVRTAERLQRSGEATEFVQTLANSHPHSPWRERALIAEGNQRVVDNSPAGYLPLFRACYEAFPGSSDAAYCHWRIVFSEYLQDQASAAAGLQTHLQNYPSSGKANAALYFLGRIAESKNDSSAARTWYAAIVERYPNSYYAILARERLLQSSLGQASESPEVRAFIAPIPKPAVLAADGFEPSLATSIRLLRARLLASSGLEDYAERELRFGAETDGQPQILAIELATLATRRDAPDQAIRYIKHYVPDYLNLPLNAAPSKFWQFAFPLPYRRALEQYSNEHALDPYFVAALVRQESEFNTRAVSVARALGLTQVLPATGRELSRKLNIPGFRPALLFRPEVNLKIGTYYLRALLDGLRGSEEAALASYNAGRSRVTSWLTWANYREPAEFVESIPFSQTREYVEIVLHNADIYRRIYKSSTVAEATKITIETPR